MMTEIRPVAPALTGRHEDNSGQKLSEIRERPGQQPAAVDPKVPPDAVRAAEETLNGLLADMLPPDARLIIEYDQAANRFVYKSVDRETGEVLHQWPPEEVMRKLAYLREISGLTVDGHV